jgi:beta-1,4-mannosyl-glycoprotein beta-1,4-N-acetylglucosaminyltransferase
MGNPGPAPTFIIDAFLANDEIELAEFRISYLQSHVDLVVIGEQRNSFSGKTKPLYFHDWIATKSKLSQRVVVVELEIRGETPLERDIKARESLLSYLIENFPGAGYIISDLDEIASKSQVERMRQVEGNFHFNTVLFYRKANWYISDWNMAVFTTTSDKNLPNAGRKLPLTNLGSQEPGCHFSYLNFDTQRMKNKLDAFAHQNYNIAELSTQSFLDYCNKNLIDHLGRIESPSFGLISQLRYDELPSVARELYSIKPYLFEFKETSVPYIKRILASAVVSVAIKHERLRSDASLIISNLKISRVRAVLLYLKCIELILRSILRRLGRRIKTIFRNKFMFSE